MISMRVKEKSGKLRCKKKESDNFEMQDLEDIDLGEERVGDGVSCSGPRGDDVMSMEKVEVVKLKKMN
jgi:hypothetical protein